MLVRAAADKASALPRVLQFHTDRINPALVRDNTRYAS